MLSSKLDHKLDKYLAPFTRRLDRLGITPNKLTVAGAVTNGVAAAALLYGRLSAGGLLVILGGLFDLLDGSLARSVGKQSRFGAVLDSALDRYSDILPILGLLIYYSGWSRSGDPLFGRMLLCGIVVLGSLMVPYVRARAEKLIERCDVGIAERAERVIIFSAGLIVAGFIEGAEVWALWILAILTHLTVIQRLLYTRAKIEGGCELPKVYRRKDEELAASEVNGKF